MKKVLLCVTYGFLSAFLLIGTLAAAQPLPAPSGDVILTVRGDLDVTNADDAAEFDREMLRDLGLRELVTGTIWTNGQLTFTGVPLKTLLDRLGVTGGTLRANALNGYSVDIPYSDAADDLALLAIDRDGAPMQVRDKGPIWVVYPFDMDAKFRTEIYHTRSIWQLNSIDILP
ncbi:molybdopterin-dependent oxidoreductase [Sagittula sp. SSi028]|uniref:molybdopterin-dependent oxidoreductase n=1 Tax=Sagittula sp. SSi028 TaxID=3400636 RepID=UPI003AF9ABDB